MDEDQPRLCERCGEEIELANDLDREPDIDRERHIIFAAGEPRQLSWQLFTLLYRRRGSVVPKPAEPEPNRDFERAPPSAVRAIFG